MPTLYFYLTIFIFGLVIGSFLNCLIYRMENGQSFLIGRSFCPRCKHVLAFWDLIPVFSFLILKGKCRYCHQKISVQYPFVEITTGILFVLVFWVWNLGFDWSLGFGILDFSAAIYYLLITCFLVIIFVYDFRHYIIPDKIIYSAIALSGIWYLASGIFLNAYTKYEILNTLYAAFGAAVFFGTIVLISRGRWMGLGDVKLAFLMGLFLGWPNILVALLIAVFLGAIIGLGLVIAGQKKLRSEIPFGPFLVTGTFIALFLGQKIIGWYLNLL
jgi:leader peptidase (prepilin peptidase)/N-methyltransferase